MLRGRDRKCAASEHDLALEADAQYEHVNLGNDDAVQIGLQKHSVRLWDKKSRVTLWRAI